MKNKKYWILLINILLSTNVLFSQELTHLMEKNGYIEDFTYHNKYIYAVGKQSSSGGIYIAKLDSTGNAIWEKNIDDGFWYSGTYGTSIIHDSLGFIYVGGQFRGTNNFGGTNLVSTTTSGNSGGDYFVAKYDSNGTLIWVNRGGGNHDSDEILGITLDDSLNCYVTGKVSGLATFNNTTFTSPGTISDTHPFIAKYDVNGNLIFFERFITPVGNNFGKDIKIDSYNNIIVAGSFNDTLDYNGVILVSSGQKDIFVFRFSTDGQMLSYNKGGGTGEDWLQGMEVDLYGNYFLTGTYSDIFVMDNDTIPNTSGNSSFVIKCNASDQIEWSSYAYGQYCVVRDIATDIYGNSQITGTFNTDCNIQGYTLLSDGRGYEVFTAKFDPNGNILYTYKYGTISSDFSLAIKHINDTTSIKLNISGGNDLIYINDTTSVSSRCIFIYSVDSNSYPCALDVNVNSNLNTLTAITSVGTYQWLDCSNSIIPGETSQSYTPILSGVYAVEISSNGCTDTSTCIPFTYCNSVANYTTLDNGNGNYSLTNNSIGNFTNSHWAFGDGTTDTTTNPNHTFTTNGTFTVVLTINDSLFNGNCFDYFIDTIVVTGVTNPLQCNAGFVVFPHSTTNDINVINSSIGTSVTYLWNFGDGNTSTLPNPSHTYATAGPFYLCLTVDDGAGCVDIYCDSIGENGVVFKTGGFTINITGTPIITEIVDITELNSTVKIYPNPTSNQLTIDTDLNINKISILDITGKTNKTITTDFNIVDISTLTNGIYFIKIISQEGAITKKFVKQ